LLGRKATLMKQTRPNFREV